MPKQILVRKVPDKVSSWIERQRRRSGKSQQEVLLNVLKEAARSKPVIAPTGTAGSEALRIGRRRQRGILPFKFIDLFCGDRWV